MHKFKEIEEIIKTMEYYNYKYINDSDSTRDKLLRRQKGEEFSLQDHLGALVFAELSNQRPWEQIENNKQKIIEIFHYFDVDYLKKVNPEELIKAIKDIHCGNRQINKQMLTLKDNILTLERIEKENGSIDKYYNSIAKYELIKSLSCGKYKLKQMGMPLVSEYLKSMGVDIIKPDVHVCRILGRLGYTEHNPAKIEEAYNISEQIAKEFGKTNIEIDSILWQYGAKGYFEQCGENPKCKTCFVTDCFYKKSTELNVKIACFEQEPNKKNFVNVINILANISFILPCSAKVSNEDIEQMLKALKDDELKNKVLTTKKEIKLKPLTLLDSENKKYIPIFTHKNEMGQYKHFSQITDEFVHILKVAKNNNYDGVVVNANSKRFIIYSELFDILINTIH